MDDLIILRALTRDDLPKTLEWHKQADIVDFYAGHPFPVNLEMEQKWFDKILVSNLPTTVFGIEILESSLLIGISLLKDIDLLNRSAETAIYIGDLQERGKGYSKIAIQSTLEFGFKRLGLHRIWLKVRTDNDKAIELYKNSGFIQEGILRESMYKNGKFHSLIVFSLLTSDFS